MLRFRNPTPAGRAPTPFPAAHPRRGAKRRLWPIVILSVAGFASVQGHLAAVGSGDAAQPRSLAPPVACAARTCYVAVNVATLWVRPWYPRPLDAPALRNPADPVAWAHSMTTAQRQWLVGRLETQALYGTRVIVIGHWGRWTHVAVPSQPTNRDRRGYPGWVPTVQLTGTAPARVRTWAVVRAATAWAWSDWQTHGVSGRRILQLSYDTRMPVLRAAQGYVEVSLIGGRPAALLRSDVVLRAAGDPWHAGRAQLIDQARRFLGLPYLWAGTSGIGYDCSGFTYAVYSFDGVTLARDADQQAVHGVPVARDALAPGDLVFFRGRAGGPISHVGMYLGAGNMIDAPHTGAGIRIEPVASFGDYAGARRYLSR